MLAFNYWFTTMSAIHFLWGFCEWKLRWIVCKQWSNDYTHQNAHLNCFSFSGLSSALFLLHKEHR